MTPAAFIAKWRPVALKERSTAQTHFNDLCRLLGIDEPIAADPDGTWFTFEKGVTKTSGGEGWADVWRKGCFGWEYKGRHKDLDAAWRQLLMYAVALENPPLLVTCDTDRIVIRTNFTNTVQETHTLALDDLLDGAKRDLLRAAFTDPERFRPKRTRDALTAEAASKFSLLALRLRERGHAAHAVAHFVNRLVFCMFAEDVGLLPDKLFQKMLDASRGAPGDFEDNARKLFGAMHAGGKLDFTRIEWFNGGLFDDDVALPLEKQDIADLIEAARLDWSQIDPSILGTLFERGLDPGKRSQLGAHYTDRDKIMKIVNPVIVEPLLADWAEVRGRIEAALAREKAAGSASAATRAHNEAVALKTGFLERLKDFRVLDPACGSGNFLYLSLRALKDIEHRVNLDAEALGLPRGFPGVGPEAVRGIELNPYAAELARVSVWIGEIQWMRANGFDASRNPILRPLDTIECRDAILNEDGTRAEWPEADVVVGNPPFLGSKFLRKGRPANARQLATKGLGDAYVDTMFAAYQGKPPQSSDLVAYWFQKASDLLRSGAIKRFGLVATKSISMGSSNRPIAEISSDAFTSIFDVWHNQEWIIDGAQVRVSLVCCGGPNEVRALDGLEVKEIHSDLTCGIGTASAKKLADNARTAFQGVKMNGPFEVEAPAARAMLLLPFNPNGRPNSDVVKRLFTNDDVTERDTDSWVVDFHDHPRLPDASLYEAPFACTKAVQESRARLEIGKATEQDRLDEFWLMQRPRPKLRNSIRGLTHVIATPETSEHRLFRYLPAEGIYSGSLFVFARSDLVFFGLLHSRIHEVWSSKMGNRLGVGNQRRYNATSTFDTFPFPAGLTPDIPAADYAGDPRAQAIAGAAAELNRLREAWLNPDDLVVRVPEVVAGYPDRVLPKDDKAAEVLKKRTLTNLYNARPAWLDQAHARLDAAVAEAYGWGGDWRAGRMGEEEILARLFALNQARAAAQG